MTLRVVIVDDEPPARARLKALVEQDGLGTVVGEAGDGRAALQAAIEYEPDLVLLDIRMPVMDGLEAAKHLRHLPSPPAVVFTTAYEEHALTAFDAGAIDYLLKPIRASRLNAAMVRARRLKPADIPDNSARTHLSAQISGELRVVAVGEIRALRAEHKYVTAIYPGGELVVEDSLTQLEGEFAERFVRVHRNALVAFEHIDRLYKAADGTQCLRLKGVDDIIEVSRRHVTGVKRQIT